MSKYTNKILYFKNFDLRLNNHIFYIKCETSTDWLHFRVGKSEFCHRLVKDLNNKYIWEFWSNNHPEIKSVKDAIMLWLENDLNMELEDYIKAMLS